MNILLSNIKHIILIASGKGGVGKSTVASNLSVALCQKGFAIGLLDADLYGPSIPISLGIVDREPTVSKKDGKLNIEPVETYGIKVMSLGLMIRKEDAVIWRGPLASNTLKQLIECTNWGDLDFLLIDMPPGTGDICITLAQTLNQAKAIIVITPQKMAIADGRKAANMFRAKGINISILGVVENMSFFIPEKHTEEKYFLFGEGGGLELANELKVPLLVQIPLVMDVCKLGDFGKTVFYSSNETIIKTYQDLAGKIAQGSPVFS